MAHLTSVDQQVHMTSVPNQEKKSPGSNVRIFREVVGVIIMVLKDEAEMKSYYILDSMVLCFEYTQGSDGKYLDF